MTLKQIFAVVLAGALIAGCAETQNAPKQTVGTLVGAAAGGLVGSKIGGGRGAFAATAAGALLGAWLGNEVGRSMDEVDRIKAEQAHTQALNTGQTIRWDNPKNGDYGSVTPTRTGTDTQTGAFCREFQSKVVVGGKEQDAYGTACRQPDGSWRIVSQ